jgi:streptogramin lyase
MPWKAVTLVSLALALPLVAPAGAAIPYSAPSPNGAIQEYPLQGGSRPYTIVAGEDGGIWFTESTRGYIGRLEPSGRLKEFRLAEPSYGPYGIALGPHGNLWFTERFGDRIGMITPDGFITEYGGLSQNSQPWDITVLPNGQVWFTEENVDQVGMLDSKTGIVTEFPTGLGQFPTSISSHNGLVWFTEEIGNTITRIDPETLEFTEFALPTEAVLPWEITPGPDGNMWFTTLAGRIIGKITPDGVITEYPVEGEYGIAGIAAGPDGRMWFTENDSGNVGSISTTGQVGMKFPTGSYPFGITMGPDGDMWFCIGFGDAIGRLDMNRDWEIPPRPGRWFARLSE